MSQEDHLLAFLGNLIKKTNVTKNANLDMIPSPKRVILQLMSDLKRESSQIVGNVDVITRPIASSSSNEFYKQKIITKPIITKV